MGVIEKEKGDDKFAKALVFFVNGNIFVCILRTQLFTCMHESGICESASLRQINNSLKVHKIWKFLDIF